jgi:pyruvate/2-oxoglutarate dehydrogenase complex dihydrolipoamide acyltransferase (E2) component
MEKIGLQAGRETKMMPPAGFTTDVFGQPHVAGSGGFRQNRQGPIQMIDTSKRAAIFLAFATFAIASPASSQAPTDAQRAAVKSQCRSDYMAHCASVPPGGMESLQCLQKNMSSLSSSCQTAVRAVGTPGEAKAEPAATEPAGAPAKPAAEPAAAAPAKSAAEPAAAPKAVESSAAKKPSSAQVNALRSACRSDYPKVCAGVPTGGAPALQCLEKNRSRVSAGCQKAIASAGGGAMTPPASGAAPAAAATATPVVAPAAPVLVLRPMLPREELFVLRSSCSVDVRALCAGVAPGGGRLMQCLAVQSGSLSPECRSVLSEFAAQ